MSTNITPQVAQINCGLLRQLAGADSADPELARASIHELQRMDPQCFARATLSLLSESLPEMHLYLLCLLMLGISDDALIDFLCDASRLDAPKAKSLATSLSKQDAALGPKLLKYLSDEMKKPDVDHPRIARALDLITELPESRLGTPYLLELLRSSDGNVRSKAVLLMAKTSQAPRWAEFRLAEPDPRVRANAIEGLWNLQLSGGEQVLRGATRDPHHRVVVNAWIGLHYIGDTKASEELRKLATHEAPLFRAAAAWGMGHLGLAEFQPVLQQLVRDTDAMVKRNALRGLIKIRKKVGGVADAPQVNAA